MANLMLRPIKTLPQALLIISALGALPTSSEAQRQRQQTDFWSDPDFVERFIGTYAPRITVEPRLSQPDKTFMEEFSTLMQTNRQEARASLAAMAAEEDSNATFHLILGNFAYQERNLQEAVRHYQAAIRKHKDFLRAHENLGFLYFQLGNEEKAREHFTTAVKLGAVDKNIFGILGYLFFENEQFIASETSYRSALIYEVQNEAWEFGLAKSILFQRKYKDAAGLFEKLIEKNSRETEYWELQADAFLGLGEKLHAASNYEVLRRMGAISAENLIALGDIYVENGFIEAALGVYKEAIMARGRLNVEKPIEAAANLIEAGFFDAASEVLTEINRSYGNSLDSKLAFVVRKLNAKIQAATDNMSESIVPLLESMVVENPLDGDVLIMLADFYAQGGNFEKAEFLYERAQNLRDFEAKAYFHHGKALVAVEQYREAVRALERAQDVKPQDHVEEYLLGVRNVYRAVRN